MTQTVSEVKINSIKNKLFLIDNSRKSYIGSIVLLLVTIFIFLSLRLLSNPVIDSLILIVVIFIHEVGHLLAMKAYKYKNVQMFFIPLFGAAVSGSETNPGNTQKAIVTLMGPLPGILLSVAAFILYYRLRIDILYQFGIISLILNAFNFLPIYPFDGGRFFDYILFSRNKYFEIAFKIIAALSMLFLAYSFGDWILFLLTVLIILSLPNSIRVARIHHIFKTQNIQNNYTFSDTIPDSFINDVTSNIKNYRSKNSKSIAVIVKDIWSRIFSKPPGIVPTILFLIVYIVTIVIILFSLVLASIKTNATSNANTNKFQMEKDINH